MREHLPSTLTRLSLWSHCPSSAPETRGAALNSSKPTTPPTNPAQAAAAATKTVSGPPAPSPASVSPRAPPNQHAALRFFCVSRFADLELRVTKGVPGALFRPLVVSGGGGGGGWG